MVGIIQTWERLHSGNSVKPAITTYNLTTGSLPASITFTRASQGSYYNSAGLLSTAANNIPRFDYNPSTLILNGLLIEQASTNLVKQSNTFATTPWTHTGTLTSGAATGPDGVAGSAFSFLASAQFQNVVQTVTVSASTTYTLSGWIRAASGTYTVTLQASDGTNFYNTAATATTSWQRFSVTFTTASSTSLTCMFQDNQTSNWQTYYIYGMQLEQLNFASSYIPTTTTSATRSGDLAIVSSIPWYNMTTGTAIASFIPEGLATGFPGVVSFNDGTTTNEIYMDANFSSTNAGTCFAVMAGVGTGGQNGATTIRALSKIGFSYNNSTLLFSVNGATPSSFGTSVPSNITQLNLGTRGFNVGQPNGWLQSFAYYNYNMTSAQLKAIT